MDERNRCLAEKLALLHRMFDQTERMGELLENDDLDALNACIGAKNGYIEDIDVLDARVGALTGKQDSETARLQEGIRETLARLMELDSANTLKAAHMQSAFIAQIRDVNMERSLQAYSQAADSQSKFVDKEG